MAFFGIDIDQELPSHDFDADAARRRIISFLKPKPSPFPLVRIGGDRDGAYLVPDDLGGISACFSPGVGSSKRFEDELVERFRISAHMCDRSCDPEHLDTPLLSGHQSIKNLWLGATDGPDMISLASWVAILSPGQEDLILQMDIEGAEYKCLLATPVEVLRRFRVIVLELHGLGALNYPRILSQVLAPFFDQLGRHHDCVHLHPNNCNGQVRIEGTAYRIPLTLEMTLLRQDRMDARPIHARIAPQLPHPLDIPRNIPSKPPIFLDDNWIEFARPANSELIRLRAELDFLRQAMIPDFSERYPGY